MNILSILEKELKDGPDLSSDNQEGLLTALMEFHAMKFLKGEKLNVEEIDSSLNLVEKVSQPVQKTYFDRVTHPNNSKGFDLLMNWIKKENGLFHKKIEPNVFLKYMTWQG